MQKTYRKLLFDLDNTLIDDDENRRYAIRQILTERKENTTTKRIESFIKMDNQFWNCLLYTSEAADDNSRV